MGTIATNPASFTGNSSFSAQLQQVIATAVARAAAPIQQLETQQSTLSSQQTELQTLSSGFQSLQTSLASVNSSTGFGALSASVDAPSVASATISSGVMAGTYSVKVISTGSRTNTISMNGLTTVADPTVQNIDSSTAYTLTVNGTNFQIADTQGSLNGLVQAINGSGANLEATVVNVGSSGSPDYRLSIQSLDYATDTVQLNDGTSNLLTTLTTGSPVQYQVNGQPSTPINSNSQTVSISPGLSVSFLQTGTANITVSQSVSGISNALSSFVNSYNSLTDELSKNRGQNGGALGGQSITYTLQTALRNLADYTASSGNLTSLAQVGITFDQNGHLQFDPSGFAQAAPGDILDFFGSQSGSGFLQAANNIAVSVTDPATGTLPAASQSITSEISNIGNQIGADQQQVNQLQTTLTAQMAAADAAISSMEQQVTEITDLFAAMQQQSRSISG